MIITTPDGAPARTALSRRTAAFAWPYGPAFALVGATAVWEFARGVRRLC